MQLQQPLNQLAPGLPVRSFYVISSLSEATKRDGDTYWRVKLQDKSGSVEARVWAPKTVGIESPNVPGAFFVEGSAVEFRGELQVNIDTISARSIEPETLASLIPASAWSSDDLLQNIVEHVEREVRSPTLKRLLLAILEDEPIAEQFAVRPAAQMMHHGYRSGLAEHALSMMRLGTLIGRHYESYYPNRVETDLLIAGALLHDLGKIWELSEGLATGYTIEGRLLGHIYLAAEYVGKKAEQVGEIPRSLVVELQHLILSHHGEYEYGAPRRPKNVEAQILHYIDQIDAKTNQFIGDSDPLEDTHYHRGLHRWVVPPAALPRPWAAEHQPVSISDAGPGSASTARAAQADESQADAHETESATFEKPTRGARTKRRTDGDKRSDAEQQPENNLSLFDGLE